MQLAWNRLAETSRRLNLNSNSLLTRGRNEYRPNLIIVVPSFNRWFQKISATNVSRTNIRKPRLYFNEKRGTETVVPAFLLPFFHFLLSRWLWNKVCVCGKSAIWKSTWPVTRKASLYPTDKCDDCLTPRKVPKARAISKNNRSIGFFFFFFVPRGITRSRVRVPPTLSPIYGEK